VSLTAAAAWVAFFGEAVVDADLAAVDFFAVHAFDGGGGFGDGAVGDEGVATGAVEAVVPD